MPMGSAAWDQGNVLWGQGDVAWDLGDVAWGQSDAVLLLLPLSPHQPQAQAGTPNRHHPELCR